MSTAPLTTLETEVYYLLRKYRVQKNYRASSLAKVTRYAVYQNGKQLTEPKPFAEARAEGDILTAREIVATITQNEGA